MFVDRFVLEPLEPDAPSPAVATYSEARGLTVLADGAALVESSWNGDTLTKVVNEEAKDHSSDLWLATKTTVDREAPDQEEQPPLLATQTFVRRENPDHHDLELLLATDTRVTREEPDRAMTAAGSHDDHLGKGPDRTKP
jgi:hypothetical protein